MLNETSSRSTRQRAYNIFLGGLFILLQLMIIAVAFLGGYLFREWDTGKVLAAPENIFQMESSEFPIVNEAYRLLRDNAYVDLPEKKQLEYGAIRGMLQAYNEPFTSFVDPPHHELQTNQLQGRFGGIGVRLEHDTENLIYLYPLPDSPALKAGVQDGDRLLAVGSVQITAQTPNDELQAAIRGPVGEKVTITVGRAPDYAPLDLVIERAEVPLPSVTWNLVPEEERVGLVHINVMAETTADEVSKAIDDLKKQGATHFILDVRNNGGGLVESGVNTARLFLRSGMVIEQQYRGKQVQQFSVDKAGPYADLPMVILVNGGTASSAEILAGAIQAQDRAPLVGTHTYGKDSIQLVFSLSDGSSLHVTAAKWWVPNLEPAIGGNGLQPDVPVAENVSEADALYTAVETVLNGMQAAQSKE